MKLDEIVRNYINENNISIREFAKRANISHTYIANIVNGIDVNPSIGILGRIAAVLGTTSQRLFESIDDDQVFTINPSKRHDRNNIPLYSSISCGTGLFVDDNIEDYIAIPDKFITKNRDLFANTAKGDSMIGKGIKSGDVLVFEKTQQLNNGEIGCFCIDENEAVCKIFRKVNGMVFLESANDKYDPIVVDVSNKCFRIIGKYRFKFSIEQ